MIRTCSPIRASLVLLSLLVLAPALYAAPGQLAELSQTTSMMQWRPLVDHDGIVLRVSGAGGAFQFEFSPDSIPVLEAVDADGYALADGSYTWEMQINPRLSQGTREALAAARASGDAAAIRQLEVSGQIPERGSMTTSGYFYIRDGAFVVDTDEVITEPGRGIAVEGQLANDDNKMGVQSDITAQDFVILDDLIVDGSACIGFDCVNGESFGFDTIRIKENNLRIKAQDTSSSASFPTNDWQITFNDSANGGANKFSIDDIDGGRTPFTIEASAPSHSLYVDDGGRLGFGTSAPVVELHVKDGDTPTLRLEQDGSSGFAPQTWDVAGNETNFFVRDVTNGSTLPFRIRPGAPTSAIYVAASGDVGFGDASPDADLDITRTGGQVTFELEDSTSGSKWLFVMDQDGASKPGLSFTRAGTGDRELRISHTGNLILEAGGSCIQFRDTDDAGNTACTTLNGTLTCVAGDCP